MATARRHSLLGLSWLLVNTVLIHLADKIPVYPRTSHYKKNGPALARLMHESDHKRFLPMSCILRLRCG